ncbi:NYN domain-containing protein [Crassisporium funariophilum]|nr:NYN domain-containing protein [Crassisporium funariophilum]
MTVQPQDKEGINIFWDYETTRADAANSAISSYELVQNIRKALQTFGTIQSFKAYWDFSGQLSQRFANLRSELCSSGVTLIDCPSNGRKELAVKMMIVDMIAFAWDHPTPRTVVVITNDRDLAYAISMLRMRKYSVVLMSALGAHQDLTSQASANLDWTRGVLGINGDIMDNDEFTHHFSSPHMPSSSAYPLPPPPPQGPAPSAPPFTPRYQTAEPNPSSRRHHESSYEPPTTVELHELPGRARRNSVFSKSFEPDRFNVYGAVGADYSSPKVRGSVFGMGDGPLFSRSQSRGPQPTRADSAPPGIVYASNAPSNFSPPRDDPPNTFFGSFTTPSKGKQREFPIAEPEDIAPHAPLGSDDAVKAPYFVSMFEPFGEKMTPLQYQANISSPASGRARSMRSASTSTASGDDSIFSLVQHPQSSSTPPSAEEPHLASDKNQVDDRKPTEEQIVQIPATTQIITAAAVPPATPPVPIYLPPSRRNSAADIKVPAPIVPQINEGANKAVQTKDKFEPKARPDNATLPTKVLPPVPGKPAAKATAPQTPQPTASGSQTAPVTSVQTTPLVPPTQFRTLVEVLRQTPRTPVSKSILGAALLQRNPMIYQTSGHKKFTVHIYAAVQAGIVQETFAKKKPCVSLIAPYQ